MAEDQPAVQDQPISLTQDQEGLLVRYAAADAVIAPGDDTTAALVAAGYLAPKGKYHFVTSEGFKYAEILRKKKGEDNAKKMQEAAKLPPQNPSISPKKD